ncbi:MAG: DUF4854 domain-containing protein [Mogibacterium sp.]|nr:DUF4854 domain-containing protein [Mogibacterium sp.]
MIEMKNRKISAFIVAIVLVVGVMATSCSEKPSDLESLIKQDETVKSDIEAASEATGFSVEVKGNDIIYSYDISILAGADEETLKDPEMLETFQSLLDSQKSTFVSLCKEIEEHTGFTGIKIIFNCNYGDEVLVSQTYTSAE